MVKLNDFSVNATQFPNGESFVDLEQKHVNVGYDKINTFFVRFESDIDLMILKFVKDFVDDCSFGANSILNMPYVPYCRMDRKEENRLFTLKSVTDMLNTMNFTEVVIMEPHSEVTSALLNKVRVVNKSSELALKAMLDVVGVSGSAWLRPRKYCSCDSEIHLEKLFKMAEDIGVYLVYPDAGAEKRYKNQIKYPKILSCSKERDFNTGNIKTIKVNGAENAQDCKIAIIVDDLCSKGGTFVGSAKALRESISGLETVILCVTHCENTIYEGSVLKEFDIDKVYTTDSILRVPSFCEETNFDKHKLVVEKLF